MTRQFRIRLLKLTIAAIIASLATPVVTSCGSTRAYWGVHNEYELGDNGYHGHKHHKHKKHKKHKHHHHHDD